MTAIPVSQRSAADRKIMVKTLIQWKKRWTDKKSDRKQARKEYDEAHKAFEAFKDDEQRGVVRDNDIQKQGSQYKTKWTHLPE